MIYKEVLQGIQDVAIWPIISFVIFFSFFVVLVWWAFTADRKYISEMSGLPLDDQPFEQKSNPS